MHFASVWSKKNPERNLKQQIIQINEDLILLLFRQNWGLKRFQRTGPETILYKNLNRR